MVVSLIACMARNRAIGFQGRLLYHLPADMARFKQLTMGHTVIMGRCTWQSLPSGALPHRRNIVVSRSLAEADGAEVVSSLTDALTLCRDEEEVFIIGGEQIYGLALPLADRLYLTIVDDPPEKADAYFPEYSRSEWRVIKSTVFKDGEWQTEFVELSRSCPH